jgi:hypothetical protein
MQLTGHELIRLDSLHRYTGVCRGWLHSPAHLALRSLDPVLQLGRHLSVTG